MLCSGWVSDSNSPQPHITHWSFCQAPRRSSNFSFVSRKVQVKRELSLRIGYKVVGFPWTFVPVPIGSTDDLHPLTDGLSVPGRTMDFHGRITIYGASSPNIRSFGGYKTFSQSIESQTVFVQDFSGKEPSSRNNPRKRCSAPMCLCARRSASSAA
jgi:hypothetical protein